MTLSNDETPSVQGKGLQDTQKNGQANSNPNPQLVGITIRKIINAGHAVQQGQIGDFIIVSRSGTCHYCADLPALQAFARQVGASQ